MLVTLKVLSADVGATVTLNVDNTFDTDIPYETLETVQLTAAGVVKRVFSDFHNLFKLRVTVAGGNATYKVAVALFDNANTTKIDNAQIDVSLDHTIDVMGHFDSVRIGDGQYLLDINPDGSINTVVVNAKKYKILNLPLVLADTEYSFSLPNGARHLKMKLRDGKGPLRVYDASGDSDFYTVSRGAVYEVGDIQPDSVTFYVQSSQAASILELIYWEI